uniref:Uncharacterized protein n=1 Tax=Rhizophora mucronata TaxID=61149 RepID=A0A2P2MBD1_RHIMU
MWPIPKHCAVMKERKRCYPKEAASSTDGTECGSSSLGNRALLI